MIRTANVPCTIVHATQFFEFLRAIADSATDDDTVRVSSARLQPIAAQDVADAVSEIAVSDPVNGVVEVAGARSDGLDVLIRDVLVSCSATRIVTAATSTEPGAAIIVAAIV